MSDLRTRAVRAAVAVAGRHGLPTADPVLLHDGLNAVVHLRPAPVVARVATWIPLLRPDPAGPQRRDLGLAAALRAAGAPVLAPADLLPPGPHAQDGFSIAFWRYVEARPERPTPAVAGRTLAALLEVMADVDPGWTGSPLDTPLGDLAEFTRTGVRLGADPGLLTAVGDLVDALRPRLTGPVQPLHGDAHPGNLLATAEGWVWADLEDTCLGPRGWDLACLRATSRLDGRAALAAARDALPGLPDDEELAPYLQLRALHAAAWWFPHAARVPADLPVARQRLAEAVSAAGGGPGRPG